MKSLSGLIIQNGIAYGKAHLLVPAAESNKPLDLYINQKEILHQALKRSTKAIEKAVQQNADASNDAISMIFEAHKLMVNDPILIDSTERYINEGMDAYHAYKKATDQVIEQFQQLTNDYMRNRIIDIQDATDRVLYSIQNSEYEQRLTFDTPRVLVVQSIKPSLILGLDKRHVCGFLIEKGSYDQHASLIAREKNIPGMIVEDIVSIIHSEDWILVDANQGKVYINPTHAIVQSYNLKGVETDEL